jgi:hypothetical protein
MRLSAGPGFLLGVCALLTACALVDALDGEVPGDGGSTQDPRNHGDARTEPPRDASGFRDASSRPDAPVAGGAQFLGQACGTEPCPSGYFCAALMDGNRGFCTLRCSGQGQDPTCSNGFPGPGGPICIDSDAMGNFLCVILCGPQYELPLACPDGLSCQDIVGPMGTMPDGMPELCLPP